MLSMLQRQHEVQGILLLFRRLRHFNMGELVLLSLQFWQREAMRELRVPANHFLADRIVSILRLSNN